MPNPPFYEFAIITLLGWVAGTVVWVLAQRCWRWNLSPRLANGILYGAVAVFAITFSVLGILRHEALNSHSYDMGVYNQLVWNISHGRFFETSLEYYDYNFLGDHLSLFLVFLAPLYWLRADPSVLIIVQAVALALAGIPIYWYAKERLGAGPAVALGLAYVLFTPTIYVVAIDFHDIVLAAPLLSWATYFMLKGDTRRFAAFAFPALLVKEEVGLIVGVMGLYWLLGQRERRFGAATALLGLAWAIVAIKLVIPSFNSVGQYYYLGRYAHLGSTQEEILASVLLRPGSVLSQVATPEKLRYLLHLVTPLGFLPLLSPGLLALVLPTIGYLLMGRESPQFLIITQYAAPIVPFLFFAATRSIARHGRGAQIGGLAAMVLVASAASYYLQSPGPLSVNFVPQRYSVSQRAAIGKELIASIPADAGVVAQTDLVPHLSARRTVHMFPEVPGYDDIDYILFDREGNRYPFAGSDAVYERALAEVMANPQFSLAQERDGYVLLKRVQEDPSRLDAVLGDNVRLYGYQLDRSAANSGILGVSLYWEPRAALSEDYSLFIHVNDAQGRRLAQWDGPPLGQHLPTSKWQPGARLRGTYLVALPPDLTAGEYSLDVGLYDWKTLERLSVSLAGQPPISNSVAIKP